MASFRFIPCDECKGKGVMLADFYTHVAVVICFTCSGKKRHGWKHLPPQIVWRFDDDPKFEFNLK